MSVKIGPKTFVHFTFDAEKKSSIITKSFNVSMLQSMVELIPGTTLENIIEVILSDPALRLFAEDISKKDIRATIESKDKSEVPTVWLVEDLGDGKLAIKEEIPAEYLILARDTQFYKSNRELVEYRMILAGSEIADSKTPVDVSHYSVIKRFELRIDNDATIMDGDDVALEATKCGFTLYEFISTILKSLVGIASDVTPQSVEDSEEITKRWERLNPEYQPIAINNGEIVDTCLRCDEVAILKDRFHCERCFEFNRIEQKSE